ncbi:MAG: dihydrofolate reductase [Wenzhouxiangellaceae bacterium]|nr:dihydrofolate reductase [Wenzhouxiangellaceae bacterium]
MGQELVLVAAMARNRVIGIDGRMPWHLPADLKHFKAVTLGHPVVMGRKTFASIGRALPGRRNLVVSRTLSTAPEGVELAGSLGHALKLAGDGPVMVIGGGELYRQALARADRLELTLVDAEPDGDTCFPMLGPDWQLAHMRVRPADDANAQRLVFCRLVRQP